MQISENEDSVELDTQEHSFTRTIDEEAELEERAERERDRDDGQQDEEERENEVMTAGSEFTLKLFLHMRIMNMCLICKNPIQFQVEIIINQIILGH